MKDYKKVQAEFRERTKPKPTKYLEDLSPKDMEGLAQKDGEETLRKLPRRGSHMVRMGTQMVMVNRKQERQAAAGTHLGSQKHEMPTRKVEHVPTHVKGRKQHPHRYPEMEHDEPLYDPALSNRVRMQMKRKLRTDRINTKREMARREKEHSNANSD